MESRDDNFMSQMMLGASFGPQNLNFKCITPTCQSYLPTCSWGTITPTPTQPRTLMHGFDVPMPILKYSTVGLLSFSQREIRKGSKEIFKNLSHPHKRNKILYIYLFIYLFPLLKNYSKTPST